MVTKLLLQGQSTMLLDPDGCLPLLQVLAEECKHRDDTTACLVAQAASDRDKLALAEASLQQAATSLQVLSPCLQVKAKSAVAEVQHCDVYMTAEPQKPRTCIVFTC